MVHGTWESQAIPCSKECFKQKIKQRLLDQFRQNGQQKCNKVANVLTIDCLNQLFENYLTTLTLLRPQFFINWFSRISVQDGWGPVNIAGSLRDREVACSASDRQGSIFESCVWRTVPSQSSHHPQEVLLAQFSLYVHTGGLKPDSFHFYSRFRAGGWEKK